MTTKQVKVAVSQAPVATTNSTPPDNIFISVLTFDKEGRPVGERLVDMCHHGTEFWLYRKHLWWAMQHGYEVEIKPASAKEVDDYLIAGRQSLADRFNSGTTTVKPDAIEAVVVEPAPTEIAQAA